MTDRHRRTRLSPTEPGYLELYPYGHRDVLHYDAAGRFGRAPSWCR